MPDEEQPLAPKPDDHDSAPHDAGACPECGARAHDVLISERLNLEIRQALNRAISKSADGCNAATLAMPLAANTAVVLVQWEAAVGVPFEVSLTKFISAVMAYRDDLLSQNQPPPQLPPPQSP